MAGHRSRYHLGLAALLLASCGTGLEGTWDDPSGAISYEFGTGGRVSIEALGNVVAGEYMVDGDRVLLTSPQGTVVLRREKDRLVGPMGAVLVRRSEHVSK